MTGEKKSVKKDAVNQEQPMTESQEFADRVKVEADKQAKAIIADAEDRAKKIIEKATQDAKEINSLDGIRKEFLIAVSKSAGAMQGTNDQIARKVIGIADQIIKQIQSGD